MPSPSSNSIRALLMIAFILLVADIPLVWADGELGQMENTISMPVDTGTRP